nr:MAG TPA: hypothetical protein [Caudoviricetes sp.]
MIDFELLSSALTIVHGNDIYKPVIKNRVDGTFIEYCIADVKIAIMMSMFDLIQDRMSLEEYTRMVRRDALFRYMNFIESKRKEEWNDALNRWKETQGDNKC